MSTFVVYNVIHMHCPSQKLVWANVLALHGTALLRVWHHASLHQPCTTTRNKLLPASKVLVYPKAKYSYIGDIVIACLVKDHSEFLQQWPPYGHLCSLNLPLITRVCRWCLSSIWSRSLTSRSWAAGHMLKHEIFRFSICKIDAWATHSYFQQHTKIWVPKQHLKIKYLSVRKLEGGQRRLVL